MQNLKTVDFGVAFTLTRPAPADYEDKDGNTQTAAANEPRFNYSNGVAQGLLLDASLSETAAIDNVPAFNASAGHWVIDATFDGSEPLKGMGLYKQFVGSGKMVVSYSGGTAKVWAGGQAIYTVGSYTSAEPTHICEGGIATIGGLTYKPSAISDADAAALATGDFEIYVPFSPSQLFSEGQQGAWYDPSDLATLFQDAAGTIPVTSDGDPVGLMLDRSKGLELGPEQAPDPGDPFTDVSGFSAPNSTVSIVDGWLAQENTGGFGRVEYSFSVTEVAAFVCNYRVQGGTASCNFRVTHSADGIIFNPEYVAGVDSGNVTARIITNPGTITISLVNRSGSSGTTCKARLLSAKKLPGNHATQSVSASRPIYKTTGLLQQYDSVDDAMNVTLPSIPAATVITAKATGVEVQYPVDLSAGSYTTNASHSGIIIREGQLSASEEQDAINYLSTQQGVAP